MRRRVGYPVVELLVVIAFIAILTAIAVPHFASTTQRAHDAAVKSDIRNAMSAEEEHHADAGEYVAFVATGEERVSPPGYSPSVGVTVEATLVGDGVRIVGSHAAGTSSWCMSSATEEVLPGDEC